MDYITNKYILEVGGFLRRMWWNGSKPFVDNINKAFICPNLKSAQNNAKRVESFYGNICIIKELKIKVS